MSGSNSYHAGGGANYVCAHELPQWGKNNVAGEQAWKSGLYGVQYEFGAPGGWGPNKPFSYDNIGGQDMWHQKAPCAVCYRPNSSANFMMTARQDCGAGNDDFTLEYNGYLVASYYGNQYRSEFVCMDIAPEARQGGSAADGNTNYIYPVEVYCGGLPCPEYVQFNEVTCAVCSV